MRKFLEFNAKIFEKFLENQGKLMKMKEIFTFPIIKMIICYRFYNFIVKSKKLRRNFRALGPKIKEN